MNINAWQYLFLKAFSASLIQSDGFLVKAIVITDIINQIPYNHYKINLQTLSPSMNLRQKKKNISKVLASISTPQNNNPPSITHHQPVPPSITHHQPNPPSITHHQPNPPSITHHQPVPTKLSQPLLNYHLQSSSKDITALRRYYRYQKIVVSQKESSMNKYKSLQINKKTFKRSNESRYNIDNSIDNSPYRPFLSKKTLNQAESIDNKQKVHRLLSKLNGTGSSHNHSYKSVNTNNSKGSFSKNNFTILSKNRQEQQIKRSMKSSQTKLSIMKQRARMLIESGSNQQALDLLKRMSQEQCNELQVLDLKGLSLLNLKRFPEALQYFHRIIHLDQLYSQKVYIYISLCQNQLNHPEACLNHINQCISLFPNYYEPFYFKGKLLMKEELYSEALQVLMWASQVNNGKKEIKMLIGECYEKKGMSQQAMIYYSRSISQISLRNIKWAIRYARLLIQYNSNFDAVALLQKCLSFTETDKPINFDASQLHYLLMLAYFKQNSYDLAYMKGEQTLSVCNQVFLPEIIRVMLTCNLISSQYHQAIYLYEKVQLLNLSLKGLEQYSLFMEALSLIIKKSTYEAILKLQQLKAFFTLSTHHNQFNIEIYKIYSIFLYYSYFIVGRYDETLREINQQKEIGVADVHKNSLLYVQMLCQAYQAYNKQNLIKTHQILRQTRQLYPQAKQVELYLAVTLLRIYLDSPEKDAQPILKSEINLSLTKAAEHFKAANTNYAAFIFYYRGLFYAWQGEWNLAVSDFEIALEKSQDNFAIFYYVRALAFANLQNYKQAINDISIAISLQELNSEFYELRVRCFQIDGNPNEAFSDLQSFIALKPDDKDIHKLAGHLLFENGAFEDALQAYNQGEIGSTQIEVYLTRSKTYFLMGNFIKAGQDLLQVVNLSGESGSAEYYFDYEIMKWLGLCLHQYIKNQCQDNYEFSRQALSNNLAELQKIYHIEKASPSQFQENQSPSQWGKIFKPIDLCIFSGICCFYLGKYEEALKYFGRSMEMKRKSMQKGQQKEDEYEQDDFQKQIFINQMHYNTCLCFIMLKDYQRAESSLKQFQISKELHNFELHSQLIQQIKGIQQVDPQEKYLDLFSMRNKLSKYLPQVSVPFQSNATQKITHRKMKLCIPYPKVEPPEITPKFNTCLLSNIDLNNIQRRLQAPWIFKERNSIKFTDKMQSYSRFQLQRSQKQKQSRKEYVFETFEYSDASTEKDMKKRLKLDAKVQQRLNKLLKNK